MKDMRVFKFLLIALLLPNSSFSFEIEQSADQYLCKYSENTLANNAFFDFFGFSGDKVKRELRPNTHTDKELRLLIKKYPEVKFNNVNSLLITRMVNTYGYDFNDWQKSAQELGYARNGLERLAVLKFLLRDRVKYITNGISEAVNYLRIAPQDHASIAKSSWFGSREVIVERPAYMAYDLIPQTCMNSDLDIKNMIHILKDEAEKRFSGPQFDLDQNKALISFQQKLKGTFMTIKNLEALKVDLENSVRLRLDDYLSFLKRNDVYKNLKRIRTTEARNKIINETEEFGAWRPFIRYLFANKSERKLLSNEIVSKRPSLTEGPSVNDAIDKDQLFILAINELPENGNIQSENDWQKPYDFLSIRLGEVSTYIDVVKNMVPILFLDYNRNWVWGTNTLFQWLDANKDELHNKGHSSKFDAEIQKALSYNVVKMQIPALEKTCQLYDLHPRQLVCPESSSAIVELLVDENKINQILKKESYLSDAAYNLMIDVYVKEGESTLNSLRINSALTVATLGMGAAANGLLQGGRLATLFGSYTPYAMEAVRFLQMGLSGVFLGSATLGHMNAWEKFHQAEENAHSNIESQSWSSLLTIQNTKFELYLSAGALALQGYFTLNQASKFIDESMVAEKGINFTKGIMPEWLKNRVDSISAWAQERTPIQLLHGFKRGLNGGHEQMVDAGAREGTLKARVVLEGTENQGVNVVKELKVSAKYTKGVQPGTLIVENGKVVADKWDIIRKGEEVLFRHKETGEYFQLSKRLFKAFGDDITPNLQVKSSSLVVGINEGIKTAAYVSQDKATILSGMVSRLSAMPWAATKWLAVVTKDGLVKVVAPMAIADALGFNYKISAWVKSIFLTGAKGARYMIPSEWEYTRDMNDTFIRRMEKETVDPNQRLAKEREFEIKNKVRLMLDDFSAKSREVLDAFNAAQSTGINIQNSLVLLRAEKDEGKIKELKVTLKSLIERYQQQLEGFPLLKNKLQMALNKHVEDYVLYHENQELYNQYWDFYYRARKEFGHPDELSKETTGNSATFNYGIWIAAFPITNEKSKKMEEMELKVEKMLEELSEQKESLAQEFEINMKKVVAVRNDEITLVDDKKGNDLYAEMFVNLLFEGKNQINAKEKKLAQLNADFNVAYKRLLDSTLDEESKAKEKEQLINLVKRLGVFRIVDFYQWRANLESQIVNQLNLIKGLEMDQRVKVLRDIVRLSKAKIMIEEKERNNTKILRVKFGNWKFGNESYQDSDDVEDLEKFVTDSFQVLGKKMDRLFQEKIISENSKIDIGSIFQFN